MNDDWMNNLRVDISYYFQDSSQCVIFSSLLLQSSLMLTFNYFLQVIVTMDFISKGNYMDI